MRPSVISEFGSKAEEEMRRVVTIERLPPLLFSPENAASKS